MIRRESSAAPGAPCWVLIAQIEHARIAGLLAEHWGAKPFAPLEPRGALLWAIYHHDDGWSSWDYTPILDPRLGRPRSFTEMEFGDSLAIWTESIGAAERQGPLEAYLVAGHFCALVRRAIGWTSDATRQQQAAEFFLRYERQMDQWLAAWQARGASNSPQLAARALAQLQMFDALSLWLCCTPEGQAEQVPTPEGPVMTANPRDSQHIELSPWPLAVERLDLQAHARRLPAKPYRSQAELAAAPLKPVQLRWQLSGQPAES